MRAALPGWDEYAGAWSSLHGGIDPRQARSSVRKWLHFGYAIAKICARLHVRPGAVTAIGLLACLLTPVFAARGDAWAVLAAALVVLTAVADTVDGALAVLTARTTRLGYVYDAIVDRIGEACWLFAFWLIGVPAYAVVAAGGLAWLHEYARSRANAAGMAEIGAATIGERPTRVMLAAFGIGMAGLVGATSDALPAGIATFAVGVWIVLSIIGFAQLFASVHNLLAGRDWPVRRRDRVADGMGRDAVGRPQNLGLDPRVVATLQPGSPSGPAPGSAAAPSPGVAPSSAPASVSLSEPVSASLSESVLAPPEAPHSPGTGPVDRPQVVDEELLREISELDNLPGASVIYTSASIAEEHPGRHARPEPDDDQADGARPES